MTVGRLQNQAEATPLIRVAIVRGPGTTVLADSLEALLAEAKGLTFSRFEYRAESGLKSPAAGVGDPDVVVATLDSFQATKLEVFFSSLERAFPHRSLVVTTTHPDAFDVFPLLEMGASDFLLPPLRSSELLPRLMRQVRITYCSDAHVQKLKEDLICETPCPVLVFEGSYGAGKQSCAEALCAEMGCTLLSVDVEGLMASQAELADLFVLLSCEQRLCDAGIYLRGVEAFFDAEGRVQPRARSFARNLDRLIAPVVLACARPCDLKAP
jgi:hypothetical protein